MKKNNTRKVIERGLGEILSGLIRQIDRGLDIYSIQDKSLFEKSVALVGDGIVT